MANISAFLAGSAVALWLLVATTGLVRQRTNHPVMATFTGLGCGLLLASAFFGPDGTWSLLPPLHLAGAGCEFRVDPLARWFLAIIGLVGLAVSVFASGYFVHSQKKISVGLVWAGMTVLFASMAGVVLAANAIVFLVAWEVMALSSFGLVAADHQQKSIRQAAITYLGATRVGTAFLMGGFLWAYALTGSWTFADWHLSGVQALGPGLLIFVGLATKAACWPFHLWLPIAHPVAPAPVSAVMSGVMVKTAVYAMVRLFILSGHLHVPYLGTITLTLGAISAFWGVIFALLQEDLKRLLAYSSVENTGIILMCLGIGLIGIEKGDAVLATLGLAAGLFHTLNHALFKSLLFLCTGSVDARTHLRSMEKLGGLARRMPWTALTFIVGSVALCALPPLNGFVSELLLYKGFFQLAIAGETPATRLVGLLLMGWLGLVGALAVAGFVKAVGVVFLGAPRSSEAEHAKEAGPSLLVAQVGLAVACLGLGVLAPLVLRLLDPVLAPLDSSISPASLWTLPYGWLALILLATLGGIYLLARAQTQRHPGRRFITWECGFGPLGPRMQYTAASFTQPISRMFGAIYRYTIDVTVRNQQPERFAEEIAVEASHESYLETRLYSPLLRGFRGVAGRFIMQLQAGSIHQYLLYMVIVLAILLWVGVGQ